MCNSAASAPGLPPPQKTGTTTSLIGGVRQCNAKVNLRHARSDLQPPNKTKREMHYTPSLGMHWIYWATLRGKEDGTKQSR
jgi:hypothetical protein